MADLADALPFAALLGVDISKAEQDEVIGAMQVRPDLCTAGDRLHGGALMAFADSLAGIGAFLNLPEGAEGTTTVESKTNFTGGAPVGAALTGVATPLKVGKRVSVWQTRITADDSNLVGLVIQTQLVLWSHLF